jgi:serine/threonine-protein kinase
MPAQLMRALAERRAELLVLGDSAALGRVYRRGSPAWASDAALLGELRRSGQRYAGLGVAAVQAETVSVSADRAVVRARVGLTAYEVVDASGERARQPAVEGEVLDFSLVRTPQGWRIEAISVPATT